MFSALRRPLPTAFRFVCLSGVAALAFSASVNAQTVGELIKNPPKDNPVVARIDKVEIHKSDVVSTLKDLPPQVQDMAFDQVYPLLIERMVNSRLLIAAGRAQKLQDDKEVKERVAAYEDRAVQEVFLNRQVKAKLTDTELKARFDKKQKDNPPQDEAHARHILVSAEADAKAVIARLDKGEDFKAIAKEKSIDSTAKDGGDLGFFTKEDMVPEFADAAFALKPGEYTKTPVKTQFGYHIIKLEETRKAKPRSFEESKDELSQEASQQIVGEIIKGLRDKTKVEILGFDGKPAPAAKQ